MKARIFLVFLLYRLLQWIALPAVLLYLSVRSWRQTGYGIAERLGGAPESANKLRTQPRGIWLHAVSVGEVLSSVRLIQELRAANPGRPVFVSVGTVAGRELAEKRLAGLADQVFYAPLDYVLCVRRVLRRIRPSLVIIMETEIWPNLWNETVKTGAALLVVNGRISDRAWPRYRRLAWWFAPVLGLPNRILAQDAVSKGRYLELGADEAQVAFAGNLKYDLEVSKSPPLAVSNLFERLGSKHVWIAASTMPPLAPDDPDEDAAVIEAFQKLKAEVPDLLMVLVPRKPEAFETAAAKLDVSGIPYLRRTRLTAEDRLQLPGVLLLDSMGELGSLFSQANVVFVGGTLASRGGHNILEPAFAGKPVIVGPHMENFAEIVSAFRGANALVEIASAGELASAVRRVLMEGDAGVGERGRLVTEAGRGATARAVAMAGGLIDLGEPLIASPWPLRLASLLWGMGGRFHRALYRSGLRGRQRLPGPVISIGGIAVGGSGKTPLAIWLASRLAEHGLQPAFLTRGYGRQSSEVLVAGPGGQLPASATGDEAQLLIRSGLGSVGIGADRAAAGRALLAAGQAGDAFVLDDGFQHYRLARDFDIVVLDGLDPFAGGRLLPSGRLRIGLGALRGASAVVIARAQPSERYEAVRSAVKSVNPVVPIFLASSRADGWFDLDGRPVNLIGEAIAFCGLGNPLSFWNLMEQSGITPVWRREFADHHRYAESEIVDLVDAARKSGACHLLTTEKDAMNLPASAVALAGEVKICWLKLAIDIQDGEALVSLVQQAIQASAAKP